MSRFGYTSLGFGSGSAATFVNEYSLDFDGTDDYVSTGEAFDTLWSGSFTISLWYKTPTSFPTGAYGVAMNFIGNDFVTSKGYIEFRHTTPVGDGNPSYDPSKPELYFSDAGAGAPSYNTYSAIPASSDDYLAVNTWYHICWTADRPGAGTTTSKMYINGEDITLIGHGSFLTSIANSGWTASNVTQIAARNVVSGTPPAELFLEGHLDELAFFDSALTSGQVTNIYNNGTPADLDTFSPEHWWRMGDGATWNSGAGTWTVPDVGNAVAPGDGGNPGTSANMVEGDRVTEVPG